MPECRCSPRSPSPPPSREEDKQYSPGEVYGTWESVYTAVYDILRAHETDLGASLYLESLRSYNTLASKTRAIPNPRPCVMMDWQNETPKGRRVCLATTLRGSKLSDMPEVFRHFCIPIFPHNDITRRTPYHLHSEPQWERENAWIIAWTFQSKSELSGLWMDNRPETIAAAGGPQPWFFGRAAMILLQSECRRRRILWSKKCSNRETAMAYFAQVKTFYRMHASAKSWVTLPRDAHGIDDHLGKATASRRSRAPSAAVSGVVRDLQNVKLDDADRRSTNSTVNSTHKPRDRGKFVARLPGINRFAALRQNSKSST